MRTGENTHSPGQCSPEHRRTEATSGLHALGGFAVCGDWLDSRDFYELMQAYRWADRDGRSPDDTVAAFEAVKDFIRSAGFAEPEYELIHALG